MTNFRWATRTDRGRVRDHNEDAVLPQHGSTGSGNELVAAVADGMGGHAGGEVASKTAIEAVSSIQGDVAMRIQAANLAVLEVADRQPRLKGMGTTLTMALFDGDGVTIGHVGDSRSYLYRDGALEQLTADHSFVGEMIAAGRLTPQEAETHPYRSVVTRAVGLEKALDVDVIERDLEPGDRLLLCSDGVNSMIENEVIAEVLGSNDEPEDAAEELVSRANEAGGADNITVVVVDVA